MLLCFVHVSSVSIVLARDFPLWAGMSDGSCALWLRRSWSPLWACVTLEPSGCGPQASDAQRDSPARRDVRRAHATQPEPVRSHLPRERRQWGVPASRRASLEITRLTVSSSCHFLQMVTRTKKIFVGGLSANTVVEDVKQYFEQFGKVSGCVRVASACLISAEERLLWPLPWPQLCLQAPCL